MNTILIYFLPAILALGIITSYEDIKEGKIRNKWVVAAIIYAFVVYIGLIINYYLNGTLSTQYLIELGTNFLIAIIIAFSMWLGSLWTAGDAKLFIAFSTLVPLSIYSKGYMKFFPSITLLINTFIPLFIVFFAMMLIKTDFEQKKNAIAKAIKPDVLVKSFISLFAIYWGFQFLLRSLNLPQNLFFSAISSVVVLKLLRKIIGKLFRNFFFISLVIASVRLIFDKSVYSLEFFSQMLIILLFWVAFSGLVSNLGKAHYSKKVQINKLIKGMSPTEQIYNDKNKDIYFIESQTSLFKIKNAPIFEQRPEGLNGEEVKKIKQWYKQKKLAFRELEVAQTLPFALFMFLGVLATILAKGNILIWLTILLSGGGV